MNNPRIKYFEQEDVLHLVITEEPEARSVELNPNITVELNAKNEMIGVEILHASSFLRECRTRLDSGKDSAIDRGGSVTAEVSHISKHGISLLLREKESFLSFEDFPWFKGASVSAIQNVQLLNSHHLDWPDLDVDLAVESIEHPQSFPLVFRQ